MIYSHMVPKNKTIITIGLVFLLVGCATSPDLNTEAPDTYLIDVRTAEEFKAGHLDSAILIPYDLVSQKIIDVTTDLDAVIIIYCRSGGRAGIAKNTLEGMGYTNITNAGGYEQLKEGGGN